MSTDRRYVATDRHGVQHLSGHEVTFSLPSWDGTSWTSGEPTSAGKGPVVLQGPLALLDALDADIYVAEPVGEEKTSSGLDSVSTSSARLTAKTPWDVVVAAEFALDCAQHAAGSFAKTELPDGSTIEEVIADVRRVLQEMADDAEHRLGRLARLGAARRLKRQGSALSDVALELLNDDVGRDVDALDDPSYTTAAAVVDAVLSAVEAARHLALPRYFDAREENVDTRPDSDPAPVPTLIPTPWGPIAVGAEHGAPYVPSWLAARNAAERARDAAVERDGPKAGADERSFQAQRLEKLLGGD